MITFSSGNSTIPTFTYDSTPLELVLNSNTLESLLLVMEACSQLLRSNFRSAIARVYRIGDSKGIKQKKHAMLWLFQVFA